MKREFPIEIQVPLMYLYNNILVLYVLFVVQLFPCLRQCQTESSSDLSNLTLPDWCLHISVITQYWKGGRGLRCWPPSASARPSNCPVNLPPVYVSDTLLGTFIKQTAKYDYSIRQVCPPVRPSSWNNAAPSGKFLPGNYTRVWPYIWLMIMIE